MLEIALAHALAGIPVIPVRVFWDGKKWRKVPCIKEWRTRASTLAILAMDWWRQFPDAVPGIELEHAGLVVLDADRHGGPDGVATLAEVGDLPPHPIVKTAGGGQHHVLTQPSPPIVGRLGWRPGIDLLGVGRFVVAPGSRRPDGARWEGEIAGPIPVLPDWVVESLSTKDHSGSGTRYPPHGRQ
jgi:Bifunctional DNA primase/polymerase, N-terminal